MKPTLGNSEHGDTTTRAIARIAFLYWFIWTALNSIGFMLIGGPLPFGRLFPPLFAAVVLVIQGARGKNLLWPRAGKWIFLYFVWAGLSLAWTTGNVGLTAWEWLVFGAQLLFVCLSMSCAIDREAVMKSSLAGVVAGGWLISLQVFSEFRPGIDLKLELPNFVQPNGLASRIALACLCAIFLWSLERRPVWAISAPLLVVALFLTTSKGSIVAFLLVALLFILSRRSGLSRKRKLQIVVGLGVVIVFALQFVGQVFVAYEDSGNGATLTGRALLWVEVFSRILVRPFTGYGFDSFADNMPDSRWYTGSAHNELLQQWFTLGMIGVAILVRTYWSLFRALGRSRSDFCRFGLYLLGFCFVRGMVEADDSHLQIAMLFCCALGPIAKNASYRVRRRIPPYSAGISPWECVQMKILLSAFACDPEEGSEPGVGWAWAYHLAKAGHEVWVLTRDYHRPAIENKLRELDMANLHFEYVGVRWVPFWMPGPGVYPYYICWQRNAYLRAKHLQREHCFDLIHHVSYSAFRNASYLYLLGAPFIFGPVGGGERSPLDLRASMSSKQRWFEALRDFVNLLPHLDPFWRSMLRSSARIVVKTEETRACLPSKSRSRAVVALENMVCNEPYLAGGPVRELPFKLLYAGRLLSWKGLHIAIRAMDQVRGRAAVRLTIVGEGEEELALKEQVHRLGLEECITFFPWIPKSAVLALHETHDAFLFPSLHDSGGTVVMEAIAHGKPVICLDLGGPAVTVDKHCARVVNTHHQTEEQVVEGIADAILELCHMPAAKWDEMRCAAVRRAQFYVPEQVIARVYGPLLESCPAVRSEVPLA